MIATILFILGAILGSFLNVVIYRLPKGKSIIFPPSSCPHCGARIKPYDNIPIVSYIILKGRCRNCGAPISPRYPIVESIVAFSFLFGYLRYGLSFEYLTFVLFILLLVPISFIDFDTMLIPDSIAIPGIIIGLTLSFFRGRMYSSILGAVIGAVVIVTIYYSAKFIYKKEAIGLGDMRLSALIGSFVGWASFLITVFIASFIGLIYGVIIIRKRGGTIKKEIPFGPFLSIGGFIVFIWGRENLRLIYHS